MSERRRVPERLGSLPSAQAKGPLDKPPVVAVNSPTGASPDSKGFIVS